MRLLFKRLVTLEIESALIRLVHFVQRALFSIDAIMSIHIQ